MIAKKYHAIAFLSILVMLLLLGLQLLGFGIGGGQSSSAAAATNSPSAASLAGNSSLSNQQHVYHHPISFDKLTGATNNQINEVLGAPSSSGQQRLDGSQYPLDHYQRQQASPVQSQFGPSQHQFGHLNPLNPFADDPMVDPFGSGRLQLAPSRQPPSGFAQHMMGAPPHPQMGLGHSRLPHHPHHHHHHSLPGAPPPPPPPPPAPHIQPADSGSTTSPPSGVAVGGAGQPASSFDSIPLASNNSQQQVSSIQSPFAHQKQQQQQAQQPASEQAYYTPPIFTYGQAAGSGANQLPQQAPVIIQNGQLMPNDYLASTAPVLAPQPQNRFRPTGPNSFDSTSNNNENNLLADPLAQQRHRQQMLSLAPFNQQQQPYILSADNQTISAAYYPDPALYRTQARAPYATQTHSQPPVSQMHQLDPANNLNFAQGRMMSLAPMQPPPPQPPTGSTQTLPPPPPQAQPTSSSLSTNHRPAPPTSNLQPSKSQTQQTRLVAASEPTCVAQLANSIESANSTSLHSHNPVLFCNNDSEYPTNEVMRALELFSMDRSIEQVLPQQLVQLLLAASSASANGKLGQMEFQRQLVMDPLQAKIDADSAPPAKNIVGQADLKSSWFPSGDFESMCKATIFMAQPRRAKNLHGQWKVIVNLPGHKYRGIAVSQMVRVEECTRPNSECSGGQMSTSFSSSAPQSSSNKQLQQQQQMLIPNSRCLQHYENQRLLAWSHQQGLHLDLFRVPAACSCHIRRQL